MAKKLIIGLSGKKQSGKNTVCDCLEELLFDPYQPIHVQVMSFADTLKQKICKDVLGLTEEQVNGTDEQKNTPTIYKWKNLPYEIRQNNNLGIEYAPNGEICNYIKPDGYMTAREIMQVVGTDIFRNYFSDKIWVNATRRAIQKSKAQVILISDVRFPSEVESLLLEGAYIIRLLRDTGIKDAHSSENALDDYDFSKERCIIFDNRDLDIEQQKQKIIGTFSFLTEKIRNK